MQTPVHNDKVIPLNRASSDAVQNLAKLALVDDIIDVFSSTTLIALLATMKRRHAYHWQS
jgi:hypothetical protein